MSDFLLFKIRCRTQKRIININTFASCMDQAVSGANKVRKLTKTGVVEKLPRGRLRTRIFAVG